MQGRCGLHPRQSMSGASASLQPVVTHPAMGHRLLRPQPGTLQALGPSSPTCRVPGTLRCHVQPMESAGMLAGQALGSWQAGVQIPLQFPEMSRGASLPNRCSRKIPGGVGS